MNKPYFSLQTPCGDIIIEDDRGNRIPFGIERNGFDCSYDIMNGIAPQRPVNTDTNYLIVIDASVLQLGCEYKIFLEGTKLNYGDSDERTECVSGCSNGYCIALGCYSPNDDEKMKQAYDYSEKKGVLKYKFIEMPPKYDESKFIGYDVEMMDDCSGFQFHMITNHFSEITFTVAWIKSEPGYEDEYEGAVQFWTT